MLHWGNVSSQIHLISPGCPRPNSALTVHKSGLKHRSSIHPNSKGPDANTLLHFSNRSLVWLFSSSDKQLSSKSTATVSVVDCSTCWEFDDSTRILACWKLAIFWFRGIFIACPDIMLLICSLTFLSLFTSTTHWGIISPPAKVSLAWATPVVSLLFPPTRPVMRRLWFGLTTTSLLNKPSGPPWLGSLQRRQWMISICPLRCSSSQSGGSPSKH